MISYVSHGIEPGERFMPTYKGNEEEDAVHDAECKAGLEHGAVLVHIQAPWVVAVATDVTQDTQVEVETAGGKVGAIRIGNAAQEVDASDEAANEAQVDKGDEETRVPRPAVSKECRDGPRRRQHTTYEEHQYEVRRQDVGSNVSMHKIGQHAHDGDQGDDLEQAPENEREAGEGHVDGVLGLDCVFASDG